MKPHDRIRVARDRLGLSVNDVALKAGVEIPAYRDVEIYEDEAFSVVPLGDLRSICRVLELDLLAMFEVADLADGSNGLAGDLVHLRRNELIQRRRTELGLTREQLGDLIGFETIAVEQMEQEPDFIEQWPLELIETLAAALSVSPRVLI
jgi:transcriptional regulator with XRE-family HTH domain